MCGVSGIIDLCGKREPARSTVKRMTDALVHRGPDADGYLFAPGLGLGHRRLSIVVLADGDQPIYNEDRSVAVMFNGELFDYPEQRAALEAKGHIFKTHADTEIIVHLYEEHGEDVFEHLKGVVRALPCRLQQAHGFSRPRSRRHLSAALVTARRLAVLRLRSQSPAGVW